MQQSTSTTRLRLMPALLIPLCLVFGCSVGLWQAFFGPPYVPQLGDPIDLRGDRIAILRLPTKPIQEIAVYEDGHANRYAYPIEPNVYSQVRLTSSEQNEFEQLRITWCKQVPSMPKPAPNELFYNLAFHCGAFKRAEAKVPVEMLPAFFVRLLQRLSNYGA